MESRIETSHGVEVPKKSRSLDLKSFYKTRVGKEVNKKLKRKANVDGEDEGSVRKKKKKRKSVKEVSLNSLKNASGKKTVDRVQQSRLSSVSHGSKDLKSETNKKPNHDVGCNAVSSFVLNDEPFHVPRRKRDFVGRKKSGGVQVLKPQADSCSKANDVALICKSSEDDLGSPVESVKAEKKESVDDFKENRNYESNSPKHEEEEHNRTSQLVESNGDLSVKKSRRKQTKAKKLAADGKCAGDKTEPSAVSSATVSNGDKPEPSLENAAKKSRRKRSKAKILEEGDSLVAKVAERVLDNSNAVCSESPEEDEENLEENAAMMLSSRFDPSCTVFNKGSALPPVDGLSFLLSSGHDFDNHRSKSLSDSESPSVDAAGRVLRPRKQEEKGSSRKRRHFYEVFYGDLDAFWLLNRRIKVFWPLDQIWYYGLVSNYDKERRLHHVKYDDRDEEWIDLQSERFKLLLLPNEVPGKFPFKRSEEQDKIPDSTKKNSKPKIEDKRGHSANDDSCAGTSNLDSVPIISWLSQSSRRVKSPFHAVKKQKTTDMLKKPVPQALKKDADSFHGRRKSGTARKDKRKVSRSSNLEDRFAGDAMKEDFASESISCPKDSKMPIVYFRRRLRKADLEISPRSEKNHLRRSKADLEISPRSEKNHLRRSKAVRGSLIGTSADRTKGKKPDLISGSLGPGRPLWSVDEAGLVRLLLPGSESIKYKFCLSFPVLSALHLYNLLGVETLGLCHAVTLLRSGTVMLTWPQVHLEILFVDSVVGLRFLLFEGCLTQVLAFVFLVIASFQKPKEQLKIVELQLPVTAIRFKLTCFQHLHKQLLFAFYNYFEVENATWVYLDLKLKKHCLLSKQLTVSECTFDNINTLQNKAVHSISESQHGHSHSIQKRSSPGIGYMGISRSDLANADSFSHSDEMCRKFPSFTLTAATFPSFFLGLHFKLFMDPSLRCMNSLKRGSAKSLEISGSMREPLNKGSEVNVERNRKALPGEVSFEGCCSSRPDLSTILSVPNSRTRIQPCHDQDANVVETFSDTGIKTHGIVQLQSLRDRNVELGKDALSQSMVDCGKLESGSDLFQNGLSVEIPLNEFGKSVDEDLHDIHQPADLSWGTNGGVFSSPNPTAPRSSSNRNKHGTPFGSLSHGWSDGRADLSYNGFGNGPKKPRTQVSYSLPLGGPDFSPKQRSMQKGLPPKRIRKASSFKRTSDVSRGSEKNLESLSCEVNVLITASDRGWREYGAKVVLELCDHNEWRLSVKLSGSTKYSYKPHQLLQPGSTNRFTHAMMWKGGKEWTLEFFDRSQWVLFKDLHEECLNRNVRAASVKNIPIPGVHVVEEGDDNGADISSFRGSSKYIRQIESDIEMALNPLNVLYDMDSDDDRWIQNAQNSSESQTGSLGKISEEMFEKTMDMFEKVAYVHQRDQLSSDEIEELMAGVGPMDITKAIYEHWRQRRLKTGMPLLRHLQSPAWETYQQKLREWEQEMTKMNLSFTHGGDGQATTQIEKPPMFAFCMKPRGLEVPNKGSKQRSTHRKVSLSGHHSHLAYGDQDGYQNYGRRSNGLSYGDERYPYSGHNYDSLDDSPLPRDITIINSGLNRSHSRRSKSRRYDTEAARRMAGSRNRLDWPVQRHHFRPVPSSQRQLVEQHFVGPDLDEFRAREACDAARNALGLAKLKRIRAQRLAYRADLAIHRAVSALMTAEASEQSSAGLDGDG